LEHPINFSADAYPRARYLSQQFVEELCSIEGMPALIREVERVVFEAHPFLERDGAVDFDEMLQHRANKFRDARERGESSLANISDQIGVEMEKHRLVGALKSQIAEKEKLIRRYRDDHAKLLPNGASKTGERLQAVAAAAETVRGYLRAFANQQSSLASLQNEVLDTRQNRAPATLRSMKERHAIVRLETKEWDDFLLKYSGDVDTTLANKARDAQGSAAAWKGTAPKTPVNDSGAYIA
jgi:hypothetical protein